MNPLHLTDAYKLDHRRQYPDNTTLVYSNWTPRGSRIPEIDEVVLFGLQYFIKKYLVAEFNENFFGKNKSDIIKSYSRRVAGVLGKTNIGTKHIEDLHDLGYLPIEIKAIEEGCSVPLRVPMFTVKNTLPEFFWLTNYFETIISLTVWLPCNSATIAKRYKKLLNKYADLTGGDKEFVQFQGHDFSMRGMGGLEAAQMSSAGHLLSFVGSDTICATDFLEEYYGADCEKEMVGVSVAATEHSVMCMGSNKGEFETFKRLITEIYPTGIVSIVSDTWDLWKVITDYIPRLKNEIMARDGKVVIRPDSGDPETIICGERKKYTTIQDMPDVCERAKQNGVVRTLWDIFNGELTEKKFMVLDSHIGVIYGDAITPERVVSISDSLMEKGFASTNMVYGIGSYTYQYNTRDTFGFAMKSTYGEVDGEAKEIYKDPITDDGLKKSAKGLIYLQANSLDGKTEMIDQVDWSTEKTGLLKTVYKDGKIIKETTLSEIRNRISKCKQS